MAFLAHQSDTPNLAAYFGDRRGKASAIGQAIDPSEEVELSRYKSNEICFSPSAITDQKYLANDRGQSRTHVRFGSEAEVAQFPAEVRFRAQSGHPS